MSRAVLGPGTGAVSDRRGIQFMQRLHPHRTSWYITWGTFGSRLHGDDRPTVDKTHNVFGTPFVGENPDRLWSEVRRMTADTVWLGRAQQRFVQDTLPAVCGRGGWLLRVCAAGPDHVHVLCDVLPQTHGEQVRRLMKRWLTQSLARKWTVPLKGWWAEEGSNKAIRGEDYLNNAYNYIAGQRAG